MIKPSEYLTPAIRATFGTMFDHLFRYMDIIDFGLYSPEFDVPKHRYHYKSFLREMKMIRKGVFPI